jgi:hypothetical protein
LITPAVEKVAVVVSYWEDPASGYRGIASIYLWQASKLNLGSNDLKESENQ